MIETDKIVIITEKDVQEIKYEIMDTVKKDAVALMSSNDENGRKRFCYLTTFDGRSSLKTISKKIYRASHNHYVVAIARKSTAEMLEGVPTTNYVTYKDKESLKKED